MKYTYEHIVETAPRNEYIKRSDGAIVPINEANSDYQRYLRWLENPDAEGFAPIFPTITTEPPTEQTQEGAE
jgi:hypothetical protein